MEKFVINGGNALKGEVRISGAKNAAVAILPAVLLSDEPCVIENLPNISDVTTLLKAMQCLGAQIKTINKTTVEIDPRHVNSFVVSKKMAEGMRASSYFLGALLGRLKRARVSPPGGCDFGVRPIDQHIKGFEALGIRSGDTLLVHSSLKSLEGASPADVIEALLALLGPEGTLMLPTRKLRTPVPVRIAAAVVTFGALAAIAYWIVG